jgi:hypothetical protein
LTTTTTTTTLRHRLALSGGWTVWSEVELRSAGFPAAWIDGLADEPLARCIDEALAAGSAVHDDVLDIALAQAQRDASRRLRELALDPSFREAVTWQNRRALGRGIESLLRRPEDRANSKDRQNEQLVASYAQRYCCKNERAGFFGASAPARLVEHGPALTVRPGDRLIARRSTYLEPWAIDALADRLTADPELRPELSPRLMPAIRLDGTTLVHSLDRRTALPPALARLLAACDGETPARRIAEQLVAAPDVELGSPEEVYALLDELATERAIIWTLEVPTTGGPPEHLLRAALDRLAPSPARDRAFAALDALERARDRVSAAAGSAVRVDEAIDELERTFVGVTGQDSVRNPGETYAGRTIVGEDCVRGVDVAIGPGIVERLAGPLELVLHSARWYTHEIARRYRAAIGTVYRELRGDGPAAVDYPRFYARLPELFPAHGAPGSIVAEVVAELHERWREVLGLEGSERRVERSAGALRPAVLRSFAAPRPGWPGARHHSPDVLIAADGIDAVNRGEFLAVLGELHAGMSSLLVPAVPNAQGDPDAPFALRDLDLGRPCVAPVWSRRRSRLDYYSRSRSDFDVELSAARSWRPRSQVLALADLVLEEVGGALEVRTRDGRVAFDVIAFLEHHLLANSFSEFGLAGGRHTPRVVVDGVVLVRERWTAAAADLAFAHAQTAKQRFVQARAWARSVGLPRRVFLKVPQETKPLFLDLASPTFVELAAKMVRKAKAVSISEMLPDLDDLWLVDAERRRYTSELRLVAVDPEPWLPG